MAKKHFFGFVLIALTLVGVSYILLKDILFPAPPLVSFAKCVRDSGARLYYVPWCPWCIKQKEKFGDGAKYLFLIDCTLEKNSEKCLEAGVLGYYPHWTFQKQGETIKMTGMLSIEKIAELSNCPLPKKY